MQRWNLFWSPEGRQIATVEATSSRAAKRKAPLPYRPYLGEMYAVPIESQIGEDMTQIHRGTTITELEEIVDSVVRCESCGDATNNAEPFCNGPICFKRGD